MGHQAVVKAKEESNRQEEAGPWGFDLFGSCLCPAPACCVCPRGNGTSDPVNRAAQVRCRGLHMYSSAESLEGFQALVSHSNFPTLQNQKEWIL